MMVSLIEKTGYFIINLLYTIGYLFINIINGNRSKRFRVQNKDIYILANGPSLKNTIKQYGDVLKEKEVMCVNMFVNTPDFEMIKPKYCAIADIKFWEKMEGIDNNSFLLEEQKKWDMISDNLVKKTNWRLYLILPDLAKKNEELISKISQNKNIKIIYYNLGYEFKGFKFVKYKLWDNQLCMPELINVLVLCIFSCITMGFKNMYLLGCDHTFFDHFNVDNNNRFYYEYSHSYDSNSRYKVPYNSFGKPYDLKTLLREYANLWDIYTQLNDYAKHKRKRIINCTDGSLIDIFDRKNIEEVL